MPAWFDARGVTSGAIEDEEGCLKTRDYVHSLIAAEVKAGIPSSRIMIGGFSQGAAAVRTSYRQFLQYFIRNLYSPGVHNNGDNNISTRRGSRVTVRWPRTRTRNMILPAPEPLRVTGSE